MTHDLKSWADWYVSCAGGNIPNEAQAAYDAIAEIARLQAEVATEKELSDNLFRHLYIFKDTKHWELSDDEAISAYRKARGWV